MHDLRLGIESSSIHLFLFCQTFIQKKGSDTKKISDTDCFELSSLAEAMGAAQKIQRGVRDLGQGIQSSSAIDLFFSVELIREPAFHAENEKEKVVLHVVFLTDQIFWSRFFLNQREIVSNRVQNSTKLYVGALINWFIQLV
jgi:hypothetical protein